MWSTGLGLGMKRRLVWRGDTRKVVSVDRNSRLHTALYEKGHHISALCLERGLLDYSLGLVWKGVAFMCTVRVMGLYQISAQCGEGPVERGGTGLRPS